MFGLEKLGSLGQGANDTPPAILSKEEVERRRKLAQALMMQGSDTAPVQHWLQGAARIGQALQGAVEDYQTTKAEDAAQAEGKRLSASLFGGGQTASLAPPATPPAGQGVATPPGNIPQRAAGPQGGDVAMSFLSTLRDNGLNNPNALAAVGATGHHESRWAPDKLNATWSDPSQSGQPGTSGGALSWRADRLQRLQQFAAANGEQGNGSAATQARFFLQEDPALVQKLNAAQTPEEAMTLMNNAWRYANYDKPGGETAARMASAQAWAARNPLANTAPMQAGTTPAQTGGVQQVAQALTGQTPGGLPKLGLPELMAAASNPAFDRMPKAQQELVRAMIQKQVTAETKDPLDQEQKRLTIQKLRNDLDTAGLSKREIELRVQKAERELSPEKEAPLSAEERASLGIPEGQVAYRGKDGKLVFGPSAREDKLDRVDTGTEIIFTRNGKEVSRVKKDLVGKEAAEEAGRSEGKLAASAPAAITNAKRSLDAIAEIEKHPNLNSDIFGGALGTPGKLNRVIPGTQAYGLGQRIEQLKGQTFLSAYDQLRGGGAITDIEGAKATAALARLDTAQSEKDFRAALKDLRDVLSTGVERARAMGVKYGTVKPEEQPASPTQPKPSADGWMDAGNGVRIREKGAR